MNLAGRIAIVTGAAVRIGAAIARGLAESRVDVCLHYGQSHAEAKRLENELRGRGVRAAIVSADLAKPEAAAEAVVSTCVERLGPPDILINSAAVFEADALRDSTASCWERQLGINLVAPVLFCREFVKRGTHGRSHIINLVDWRAERPVPGHLSYTASKAGLIAVTKILAQELAPSVQVNAIALGAILPPDGREADHQDRADNTIPLRRAGTVEDVVQGVLFLLRFDFVTGEILHVTGGEELAGNAYEGPVPF